MHEQTHQISSRNVPSKGSLRAVKIIAVAGDGRAGRAVTAERQLDDAIAEAERGEDAEHIAQVIGLVRGAGDGGQHKGHHNKTQPRDEIQKHHYNLGRGVTGEKYK